MTSSKLHIHINDVGLCAVLYGNAIVESAIQFTLSAICFTHTMLQLAQYRDIRNLDTHLETSSELHIHINDLGLCVVACNNAIDKLSTRS